MANSHELVGNVMILTLKGEVTTPDIKASLAMMIADDSFRSGMGVLLHDLGSTYNPSDDEIREVALFLSVLKGQLSARLAYVVNTDLHYGIGRMLRTMCDDYQINIGVFRSLDTAQQWLTSSAN